MKRLTDKQGFTLIEIIVVLVIMGIMAVGLNSAITYGVQHFVFARNADQLSQKAQLAMARINRELTDMTAVSTDLPDQIDYTLMQKLPDCPTGCLYDYSMKKTGTEITLERKAMTGRPTVPVVAPKVLIDGVTANYGVNSFLSYFKFNPDGTMTAWTTTDGFSTLATIKVQIYLDSPGGGNPLDYQGTINPRANGILTAPKLN